MTHGPYTVRNPYFYSVVLYFQEWDVRLTSVQHPRDNVGSIHNTPLRALRR